MPSGSPLIPTRRGCPSTSPPSPRRTPTRTATSRRAFSATQRTLTRWSTGPSAISSAKNATNNDGGGGGRSRSEPYEPKPKDKQRGARGGSGKHGAGSERHSSPLRGDPRLQPARVEGAPFSAGNGGGYASDDSRGRDRRSRREQQRDPRNARGKTGRGDGGARSGGDRHKWQREMHNRGAESDASGSRPALGGAPVARVWMSPVTKPSRPPGGGPRWSAASCLALGAGCWAPRRYLSLCRPALPPLRWSTC